MYFSSPKRQSEGSEEAPAWTGNRSWKKQSRRFACLEDLSQAKPAGQQDKPESSLSSCLTSPSKLTDHSSSQWDTSSEEGLLAHSQQQGRKDLWGRGLWPSGGTYREGFKTELKQRRETWLSEVPHRDMTFL